MAQMKRQQQAFIDKSQTQELKMDTEEAEGGEEEGGTTGEVAPSVYPGHPTAVIQFASFDVLCVCRVRCVHATLVN
jgi:hypothetical protein